MRNLDKSVTGFGASCAAIGLALAAVVTPAFGQVPAPDAAPAASACPVADDPAYAVTVERAVQVGGGAMFVASRERRYLDALRGPAGQPVRYKRTASQPTRDGQTILDVYEVAYDGAERPVTIYLDAYHFDDALRAPKGFTCGTAIALAPPGPDQFQASRFLLRLAVEQGASRDFAPIPLDGDPGAPSRGVVLDHFRMMARVARAAAAAGTPIVVDPAVRPPDSLRQRTVVVAYPRSCEGRTIAPQAIELASTQGQAAPRQGEYAAGDALAAIVPGLDVPAGSIAATFGLQAPRANDSVKITYAEACGGVGESVTALRLTPMRPISTPEPIVPADAALPPGAGVRLQAQVDLDGALTHVTYVGGPRELLDAAVRAVRTWTVDPVRINNAPLSTPVALQVKFLPRSDK